MISLPDLQRGSENFKGITDMLTEIFPKDSGKRPEASVPEQSQMSSIIRTPRPPDPPSRNHTPMGSMSANNSYQSTNSMNRLSNKIGFPDFDGTLMRDWLYKCDQFFLLDNTPSDQRVQLASIHMSGKALKWHHNFMGERYGIFPTWPEYIIALSKRFGENFDDPLSELVNIKQEGDSVDEFLEKFESVLTRLSLPPNNALSIFLANLNPHLTLHTRQFEVTSVADAARIARLHENYLCHTNQTKVRALFNPNVPKPNTYPRSTVNTSYKPTENTSPNTKPTFIPQNTTEKYPRKYSYEEMQERKNNGLCMFCDEKFTPGHQQKHRKAQIYVMECEEDGFFVDKKGEVEIVQSNETLEEAPVLSLNAISGSTTFNCMRLLGLCGTKKLFVLIDPGSTHNFLDIGKANEIGCLLEETKPMAVAAAHGDNMITNYKCVDFVWSMQGYKFHSEVRVLPLTCCDLVLGVQWLTTLGPIRWDFSNLRMEFTLQNVKHVLRGSAKSTGKVVKSSSLNKLLLQTPQLAMLQVREFHEDVVDSSSESSLFHIADSPTGQSESPDLKLLLESYVDIFSELNGGTIPLTT